MTTPIDNARRVPLAGRVNRNAGFRIGQTVDDSSEAGSVATAVAKPVAAAGKKVVLPADPQAQQAIVDEACREQLNQLVSELNLCRRYYETTFPNKPVDRLV